MSEEDKDEVLAVDISEYIEFIMDERDDYKDNSKDNCVIQHG